MGAAAAQNQGTPGAGMAVDAHGGPVVDPTQNVLDLTEAANRRQDDLREAERRYQDAQVAHAKELVSVRADHAKQLGEAESKRIDAIRAVDVNAVAVASERQAAAATVLANQVVQSADALRTLVATTAATMAEQQRVQSQQFNDRLTQVERSQYEGRGRQLVTDPQMEKIVSLVEGLGRSAQQSAGKVEGINWVGMVVVGAVGLVGSVITIVIGLTVLYALLKP